MGEPQYLPGRSVENTYLPLDILSLNKNERFLDCGATGGEMTQEVLRKCGNHFSEFHAIEADQISFKKLQNYFDHLPHEIKKKLILHNCAVGGKRCVVRFSNTGQTGSKISDEGIAVECFPVDELFADAALTFLKMDIEGAEYDALLGAREVIERDQPILAICVYHTQNDIWRIPLLVHDMLPKHKLYLRAYEGDGFQTVMYAVPPDRVLQGQENAQ
jgi:FkbM family methyltransferase